MVTTPRTNIILFPFAGVSTRTIRRVQKAWRQLIKAGDTSGWMLIEADSGSAEELIAQMSTINTDSKILIAGDDTKASVIALDAMRAGYIPVIIGTAEDCCPTVEHLYTGLITPANSSATAIAATLRMLLTDPHRRAAMRGNARDNTAKTV